MLPLWFEGEQCPPSLRARVRTAHVRSSSSRLGLSAHTKRVIVTCARSTRKERAPTIDPQDLAVDEPAARSGEERDGVGNLRRLGITDERLHARIHPVRIKFARRLEPGALGRP